MAERITVSIERELAEELRKMARKKKVSLSKLVAETLKEYLVERERKASGRQLLEVKLSKDEVRKAFKELTVLREESR